MTNYDNCIGDVVQVIDKIGIQITEHHLLGKLNDALDEEIDRLKKQYGEEAVYLGEDLINTFTCLNKMVDRLKERNVGKA